MLAFLRLIRFPNLLIIALTQYLIRYCIIMPILGEQHLFSDTIFMYLVLATVLVAAGGYTINDYFDTKVDAINRSEKMVVGRKIKRRQAQLLHLLFTITSIAISFYVGYKLNLIPWAFMTVGAAILLWFYTVNYKKKYLVGNLVISLLTTALVVTLGLCEIIPALSSSLSAEAAYGLKILLVYAGFSFLLTLIREIIKDVEDRKGDASQQYTTLAIVLGVNKSKKVIISLSLITGVLIFSSAIIAFGDQYLKLAIVMIAVLLPLLYLIYKVTNARATSSFSKVSLITKIIMLTGLLSMLLIY